MLSSFFSDLFLEANTDTDAAEEEAFQTPTDNSGLKKTTATMNVGSSRETVRVTTLDVQSRPLSLDFLGSTGIKWPYEPKLSAVQLRKLVEKALDISQEWDTLKGSASQKQIDMSLLRKWKVRNPGETIHSAVQRWSMQERFSAFSIAPTELSYSDQLDRSLQLPEAFMELRKVPMALAITFDSPYKNMIFTTPEKRWNTFIFLKEVFAVDQSTPVFLVQAVMVNTKQKTQETQKIVKDFQEKLRAIKEKGGNSFPIVKVCSPEEHLALRFLLEMNSKRLKLSTLPLDNVLDTEREEMSFILPLGPIDKKDLGHLANLVGCAVCGKGNVKKCARCSEVSYCGSDCQRKDWPLHKESCTPIDLATGMWLTFEQRDQREFQSLYAPGSSLNSRSSNSSTHFDPNAISPNPHGSRPFISKIQVNQSGAIGLMSFLIYDRKRELTWQQLRWNGDPEKRIMLLVLEKGVRGGNGGKLFMWTKRTGDKEIRLCMDILPKQDLGW